MAKWQRVQFRRAKSGKYQDKLEEGIAFIRSGFDVSDIEFIIDAKGDKVPEIWNYWLRQGPAAYIDTDYEG